MAREVGRRCARPWFLRTVKERENELLDEGESKEEKKKEDSLRSRTSTESKVF